MARLEQRPRRVVGHDAPGGGGAAMAAGLPRHAWGSCKSRRKGARLWAWPPAAHAAPRARAPGAQAPNGAQPRAAPRARRHFGGRPRRAPPGGGAPPAALPGDTRPAYERARGAFLLADSVAFPILVLLAVLILKRLR